MLRIDSVEIAKTVVIDSIEECEKKIGFKFNMFGKNNIKELFIFIHFDHRSGSDENLMRDIEIEKDNEPIINTGQDDDDFWLNVSETIEGEIEDRFLNILQEEKNAIAEEIYEEIRRDVKTLGITVV